MQTSIPDEMVLFINSVKVATVCCCEDNLPWCFNCYYAFRKEEGLLIFKSSSGTRHESTLGKNRNVAGTIIPEQIVLANIQGIQFEGTLLDDSIGGSMKAAATYYLAFPFAMAVPGKLYLIQLDNLKFTDNKRAFGYKSHWRRD